MCCQVRHLMLHREVVASAIDHRIGVMNTDSELMYPIYNF